MRLNTKLLFVPNDAIRFLLQGKNVLQLGNDFN